MMENIGYISYARAALLERATDVTSNNIANSNTAGYKSQQVLFESLIARTAGDGELAKVTYAIDKGTISDITTGSIVNTGNPLDVAVTGDGWLAYMTREGQMALGRDGSLLLTNEGDLVTASGDQVLDIGGAPVNIPPGMTDISIASDGTISGNGGDMVAQIGIFNPPDITSWTRMRGSMMAPREGGIDLIPADNPSLMQGHIEQSNVNPITEVSKLITLQRAYDRALTLATTADDLRKQTLSRIRSAG